MITPYVEHYIVMQQSLTTCRTQVARTLVTSAMALGYCFLLFLLSPAISAWRINTRSFYDELTFDGSRCWFNGESFLPGEQLPQAPDEPCSICSCAYSDTPSCYERLCIAVSCDEPVTAEGDCCPRCPTGKAPRGHFRPLCSQSSYSCI